MRLMGARGIIAKHLNPCRDCQHAGLPWQSDLTRNAPAPHRWILAICLLAPSNFAYSATCCHLVTFTLT